MLPLTYPPKASLRPLARLHSKLTSLKLLPWLLVLALFLVAGSPLRAQFTDMTGYMNIFDANQDGSQGGYNWGSPWTVSDLEATGPGNGGALNVDIVLGPNTNTFDDPDTGYWRNPEGTDGGKFMEALAYVERDIGPQESNAQLDVDVTEFTINERYLVTLFVKVLNPAAGWSVAVENEAVITTTGAFSVSLPDLTPYLGMKLQMGTVVEGLNANQDDDWGQVILQVTNRSITIPQIDYPPTSADQLLINGDFELSQNPNYSQYGITPAWFWDPFEGCIVDSENPGDSPDGSNFLRITGQTYAGSWYDGDSGITIEDASAGKIFVLSFDAFFPTDYQSSDTSIAFYAQGDERKNIDLGPQLAGKLGEWHNYEVSFTASDAEFDQFAANGMRFKIQPESRTGGDVLLDNFVLKQRTPVQVGPQLAVVVGGGQYASEATTDLFSPLVGYSTPYLVSLVNSGAEELTISSVSSSPGDFTWVPGSGTQFPVTLLPGEFLGGTLTVDPATLGQLSGALSVVSTDPDSPSYLLNLQTSPLAAFDDFESGTFESLGYTLFGDYQLPAATTTRVEGGVLNIAFNATPGASEADLPYLMGIFKDFASPYSRLDEALSSMSTALKQAGSFDGLASPVQVVVSSLSATGAVTGSLNLGDPIDETTAGALPGSDAYFEPDGITDRFGVVVNNGLSLAPTPFSEPLEQAVNDEQNANFDFNASAFRLTLAWTDFNWDLSANNTVQVDALGILLAQGVQQFVVANPGFEADSANPGGENPPVGYQQNPSNYVSKQLVVAGSGIYNNTTNPAGDDPSMPFVPIEGNQSIKVYGQYRYIGGVFVPQDGTLFQSWPVNQVASLVAGAEIYATVQTKIYSVDALSGGNLFNYGFVYLDALGRTIGEDLAQLNESSLFDEWVELAVDGVVPADAVTVQLITRFEQPEAGNGSVYLDSLAVGFGSVSPSPTPYQQYLEDNGYPPETDFADPPQGSTVPVGLQYATGSDGGILMDGASPSELVTTGTAGQIRMTCDLRVDDTMEMVVYYSADLTSGWTEITDTIITTAPGAPQGFVATTISFTPSSGVGPNAFLQIQFGIASPDSN